MQAHYDSAQICLNGHLINMRYKGSPARNQDFCKDCGTATVHACEHCNVEIRGAYNVSGIADLTGHYDIPSFCHSCGKAYPWTQQKLDAMREMTDELDELTDEEKDKLKQSLDDIIAETPKTEVAILRFKKILTKLGKDSYEGIRSILVDVTSEAIRKSMFGE